MKIGRPSLLIGCGVAGTLFAIALLTALQGLPQAFFLIAVAWIIMSGYTSINAVVKAELSPARVRAAGIGLPYAVTVSIFGGTAGCIALWLKSISHKNWLYCYLTGCIARRSWPTCSCAIPRGHPP